jgi:hypothetical protein
MRDIQEPPRSGIQPAIEDGIRRFSFEAHGLDVDPGEHAEWVPALAERIIEAIADRATGITGQAGEASR